MTFKNFVWMAIIFSLLVLSSNICAEEKNMDIEENRIEHNIGIGAGLPYGGFGLNYEMGLTDYFAPTIGVGAIDVFQWNAGFRLYYPGRNSKLRFRATFLYGVNTIIETKYPNGSSDYEGEEGASVGLGIDWRFGKKWGFTYDMFYADSDIPDGYEEKSDNTVTSIGFVRRF